MVPPERIEQSPPELFATMLFWRTTLLRVPRTPIPPLIVLWLMLVVPPMPSIPPPLKVLWLIVAGEDRGGAAYKLGQVQSKETLTRKKAPHHSRGCGLFSLFFMETNSGL